MERLNGLLPMQADAATSAATPAGGTGTAGACRAGTRWISSSILPCSFPSCAGAARPRSGAAPSSRRSGAGAARPRSAATTAAASDGGAPPAEEPHGERRPGLASRLILEIPVRWRIMSISDLLSAPYGHCWLQLPLTKQRQLVLICSPLGCSSLGGNTRRSSNGPSIRGPTQIQVLISLKGLWGSHSSGRRSCIMVLHLRIPQDVGVRVESEKTMKSKNASMGTGNSK
ncbi:unnamed protein product [Urochloa humidicola]